MSDTSFNSPTPTWLLRLTAVSASLAVLALIALLWARWGAAVVLMSDIISYCF